MVLHWTGNTWTRLSLMIEAKAGLADCFLRRSAYAEAQIRFRGDLPDDLAELIASIDEIVRFVLSRQLLSDTMDDQD